MADHPIRIQRQRTAGWRMPADTVYVGRPTRWGNPYRQTDIGVDVLAGLLGRNTAANRAAVLVSLYPRWLSGKIGTDWDVDGMLYRMIDETHGDLPPPPTREEIRAALSGRNLACWCPLEHPCHADILLAIVNGPACEPIEDRADG